MWKIWTKSESFISTKSTPTWFAFAVKLNFFTLKLAGCFLIKSLKHCGSRMLFPLIFMVGMLRSDWINVARDYERAIKPKELKSFSRPLKMTLWKQITGKCFECRAAEKLFDSLKWYAWTQTERTLQMHSSGSFRQLFVLLCSFIFFLFLLFFVQFFLSSLFFD